MFPFSLYIIVCFIALFVGICLLIFLFLNEMQILKLEHRFEAFSMKSNTEYTISFMDILSLKLWKWVKKISTVLKKSHVCKNYAKHYEKFIDFDEKDKKESMDYIAFKLIIGILFFLLKFLMMMFKLSSQNPISFLLSFGIGFFLLDIFLNLQFKKKRKEVREDLLKAVIIMNNSFKSGKNIMQAINNVKQELNGPIADEFKKIYMDITYGLSLEVVFERFYERIKLEDAKYIASSLTLLNKTGGNIVRVFASIEKSFFNKKRMQEELNSLTASSVFVFRILVALPIIFSFIIILLSPSYFHPLFSHPLGILILALILLLYTVYIITIKKVLKVKM